MSKQLLVGQEILIAPRMLGGFDNDIPYVHDEDNDIRLDPTILTDKITIYEREVIGWFLDPAIELIESNSFNNAFIVIMICMSYIEGVEQYRSGESSNNHSREFFIRSINRIYNNEHSEIYLGKLYNKTRCGLFHNGMVKGGVVFSNQFSNVLEFHDDGDKIQINPSRLLSDMIDDFSQYISELRSDDNSNNIVTLKDNFDEMFSILPTE